MKSYQNFMLQKSPQADYLHDKCHLRSGFFLCTKPLLSVLWILYKIFEHAIFIQFLFKNVGRKEVWFNSRLMKKCFLKFHCLFCKFWNKCLFCYFHTVFFYFANFGTNAYFAIFILFFFLQTSMKLLDIFSIAWICVIRIFCQPG